MNYLQLVNRLRQEGGVSGEDLASLEGNLPREIARLRTWIADSWVEIQMLHERHWRFMFTESSGFTVPIGATVLNPTEYAADDVAEWDVDSFRIAPPGGARKDSKPITYQDYFWFRDSEGLDPSIQGTPRVFTVHPNTEALHIAPASDAEYVLYYDYRRQPQVLTNGVDIPIIPARFHPLIVYWALEKYAIFESAQEVLLRAQTEKARYLANLEVDQLPDIMIVGLIE
jgi:hypothetical protein